MILRRIIYEATEKVNKHCVYGLVTIIPVAIDMPPESFLFNFRGACQFLVSHIHPNICDLYMENFGFPFYGGV